MRRLRAAIEGLDVGVLVNNAGVLRPSMVYLHEADVEALVRMVRVNLWALTEVTAAVLPGMLERRRRGAIVNMGSASSEAIPSFPLNTIYAATKRYVRVRFSTLRCCSTTLHTYKAEATGCYWVSFSFHQLSLLHRRLFILSAGTLPCSPGAFTSSIEAKGLMYSAR
jgi:NADP-dependent 3-hydroxy acid dehydrogenase YdfG